MAIAHSLWYKYICTYFPQYCRDLRKLDPQWVRGSVIGYINQEPVLFATSVIENIRYGRLLATNEEVSKWIVALAITNA